VEATQTPTHGGPETHIWCT